MLLLRQRKSWRKGLVVVISPDSVSYGCKSTQDTEGSSECVLYSLAQMQIASILVYIHSLSGRDRPLVWTPAFSVGPSTKPVLCSLNITGCSHQEQGWYDVGTGAARLIYM